MRDPVETFFRPGELVVDLFSGRFSTAKACFELLQHHPFVDCKVDSKWLAARTDALVETYATQVLNKKLDIWGIDMADNACMIVLPAPEDTSKEAEELVEGF